MAEVSLGRALNDPTHWFCSYQLQNRQSHKPKEQSRDNNNECIYLVIECTVKLPKIAPTRALYQAVSKGQIVVGQAPSYFCLRPVSVSLCRYRNVYINKNQNGTMNRGMYDE